MQAGQCVLDHAFRKSFYLWIGTDGGVERIGAYVKELSAIDYDLPILNKALVDYMVKKYLLNIPSISVMT